MKKENSPVAINGEKKFNKKEWNFFSNFVSKKLNWG